MTGDVDDTDTAAEPETDPDAEDAADVDWQMAPDSDAEFETDAELRETLREVAEDVRGESSESKQVAAMLYRVSDLYDPDEDTSPEEIYLNMRHIMNIKAQGGIER
ncbi:hypothetical protein [Haloparvum sp. PAK95]|uniref:hypothetical protein n=1 Tax=Haloparvum sp. PAK95 TaxID=3418962 RepID=UPI003D2F1557